jgi:hypothetical protein
MSSWQRSLPSSSRRPANKGVREHRSSAGRRALPLSISLQGWMCVHKPLSVQSFHGVLAGNVHEGPLKSSMGKVKILWQHWCSDCAADLDVSHGTFSARGWRDKRCHRPCLAGKAPEETTATHGAPVFRYVRAIAACLWIRLNLTRTISARFQYVRTNAIDGARSLQYLLSHVRRRMDLGLAVFFPRREKSKDEVRYARKSIGVI